MLDRPVRQAQSRLKGKIPPITGRAIHRLADESEVVRMYSSEKQFDRGAAGRVEFKNPKAFLRPEDLSARDVPAEASGVAELLCLRQVGFLNPAQRILDPACAP